MKTNLKNFPKCCHDGPHFCEVAAWKVEFKRELRQLLPSKKEYEEAIRLMDFDVQEKYRLIRAILGEQT